jgi:hypothetical protein
VSNTDAHKPFESHLHGGALRCGKSNTNRNASSNRDAHPYVNADSFADRAVYAASTTTPHPSTAPVTSLYENETHCSIRIL